MSFRSINPATEAVLATYTYMDPQEIETKLQAGWAAQRAWAKVSVKERIKKLETLQALLMKDQLAYALRIATEMGKPITQGQNEIAKCARLCTYYAEHAEVFLKPDTVQTEYQLSQRIFSPMGLILGIMPWNYPFWQVFRYVIPNLVLGNGAILKHAPNVTGCALDIEKLFQEAGFTPHLMQSLIVDVADIPALIHHLSIRGVTITGSCRAGRSVAREAGDALKKVVLELGGSDPYLVLEDADLEKAAKACVQSRLGNTGQVCIAAKRILVHASIEAAFVERVLALVKNYSYGDPTLPETMMGPMARSDLRETLDRQVKELLASGAQCVLGGVIPEGKGYYYPATVMLNVSPDSVAFREELFGPVICITRVESEAEAIRLANATPYGLSAAVFTEDLKRAEAVVEQLDVGACAVNTYVSSDPRLPFGGTKQSGHGRELAVEGVREFANIKTLLVAPP